MILTSRIPKPHILNDELTARHQWRHPLPSAQSKNTHDVRPSPTFALAGSSHRTYRSLNSRIHPDHPQLHAMVGDARIPEVLDTAARPDNWADALVQREAANLASLKRAREDSKSDDGHYSRRAQHLRTGPQEQAQLHARMMHAQAQAHARARARTQAQAQAHALPHIPPSIPGNYIAQMNEYDDRAHLELMAKLHTDFKHLQPAGPITPNPIVTPMSWQPPAPGVYHPSLPSPPAVSGPNSNGKFNVPDKINVNQAGTSPLNGGIQTSLPLSNEHQTGALPSKKETPFPAFPNWQSAAQYLTTTQTPVTENSAALGVLISGLWKDNMKQASEISKLKDEKIALQEKRIEYLEAQARRHEMNYECVYEDIKGMGRREAEIDSIIDQLRYIKEQCKYHCEYENCKDYDGSEEDEIEDEIEDDESQIYEELDEEMGPSHSD
ncbi:hypothetical protein V8F20_006179 [Naviculisporaceae sp. PSN 640]